MALQSSEPKTPSHLLTGSKAFFCSLMGKFGRGEMKGTFLLNEKESFFFLQWFLLAGAF